MFIDPRNYPPVDLQDNLAPVDHPQFLPGAPHNLPQGRDLPARRGYAGQSNVGLIGDDGTLLPAIGPGAVPSAGPFTLPVGGDIQIYDPHHYARLIEGNFTPTVLSQKVLDAPANKRNYLYFRNGSTTANIRISFGRDASSFSPMLIAPGIQILLDVVVPQDDIYCQLDVADATASLLYAYSTIAG